MPVPRDGFYASDARYIGIKQRIDKIERTLMMR